MYVAYRAFRGVLVFVGILCAPLIFFERVCSVTFKMGQEDSNILAGIIWVVYIVLLILEYTDETERISRKVRNKCREEFNHISGK
jgi:ABC-type uncharacterized transport system permease subunit